jgi:hypothetical protein
MKLGCGDSFFGRGRELDECSRKIVGGVREEDDLTNEKEVPWDEHIRLDNSNMLYALSLKSCDLGERESALRVSGQNTVADLNLSNGENVFKRGTLIAH